MEKLEINKKKTINWFLELRNNICDFLENIERENKSDKKFEKISWDRKAEKNKESGGGEMSVLRGKVFEKAGVNISTVYGKLSKDLIGKIPGTEKTNNFWASGISLVIHPKSPHIPAIHMNTRYIITSKSWFGGGADITPTNKDSKESKELANFFHSNYKKICEEYKVGSYTEFKKWCDDYFFLPHRNESRGLGGIFYDYLDSGDWESDFTFTRNVGKTFLDSYRDILKNTIDKQWSKKDKELQLLRRSRYTEFNLLYDRGTKFGLMTNGNPDAIFMSLPPSASW